MANLVPERNNAHINSGVVECLKSAVDILTQGFFKRFQSGRPQWWNSLFATNGLAHVRGMRISGWRVDSLPRVRPVV